MSTPPGLVTAPPCRPLPPRRLGGFQIIGQIASGRRADVLLGHREGEPTSALRIRTPKAGHDARAFTREAQRAIAFGGPGSPVGVEEVDRVAVAWGPPVVGESMAVLLESIIAEAVPLPVELAITLAMGIAERLGKGGRHVHGDLAPHHVIIGFDGSVALVDPAGPDDAAERAGAPGRAGYRSPEHVNGHAITSASDVFVLGTLLYELTTATRLFHAPTAREVDAAILAGGYPKPRAVLGDHYPIELQVLLRKLLRAQPEGRFPDGEAALEGLRLAASVRTEGQQERVGEWMRARFRDRYRAWGTLLAAFGVDMAEDPLDFDADPTENPDPHELAAMTGRPLSPPPSPAPSVPWPVWSPPSAPHRAGATLPAARPSAGPRSPVPAAVRRASTLPSPRPAAAPLDLDEQTRPVSDAGLTPPDRLSTSLDLRLDARPRGVADPTDPNAQAVDPLRAERGATDARALAASRERTVVSTAPRDPDEQTWVEASPAPTRPTAGALDDGETTQGDSVGVAWDLELPDDIDPDETADEGDIPSLLDDADLQMLSGSEATTPAPRRAPPVDLASDLLGEDFRSTEQGDPPRLNGRTDERVVPEPRKVRLRGDSTMVDPSAAPTQVGAAATPMPAAPSGPRRAAAPTALLEGLTPPPVRPAPAPTRREQTVIVRQRVIPRDTVQPEVSPDDATPSPPETTSPLIPAMAAEVSDAEAENLLVIPVSDEDGGGAAAPAKKKPQLTLWLVAGAAVLLALTAATWWFVAAPAPAPAPSAPAPKPVIAVPGPPAAGPASPSATSTGAATATVPEMLEPEPDDPEPAATPPPSPSEAALAPSGAPSGPSEAPEPAPSPEAADPAASPDPADTEPSASPRAPAPRRRPTPPPAQPPPPAPTAKGPVDIKVTAFPATATLRVGSQTLPSGSAISVGDEPVVVTVSADGYQEQMVELRAGPRREISVVLRRKR